MRFKSIRAAFDWWQKHRGGTDDSTCWRAVWWYDCKTLGRYSGPAGRIVISRALYLSNLVDGPDDTGEAADDLAAWTNGPGDAALIVAQAYTDQVLQRGDMVVQVPR